MKNLGEILRKYVLKSQKIIGTFRCVLKNVSFSPLSRFCHLKPFPYLSHWRTWGWLKLFLDIELVYAKIGKTEMVFILLDTTKLIFFREKKLQFTLKVSTISKIYRNIQVVSRATTMCCMYNRKWLFYSQYALITMSY